MCVDNAVDERRSEGSQMVMTMLVWVSDAVDAVGDVVECTVCAMTVRSVMDGVCACSVSHVVRAMVTVCWMRRCAFEQLEWAADCTQAGDCWVTVCEYCCVDVVLVRRVSMRHSTRCVES